MNYLQTVKSKIKFFMSKIKVIPLFNVMLTIGVIFSFIIIALYFNQFSVSLSSDQSDWAGFGSYIGGTLGTLFAFLSFWILFYTFGSQKEQARNNKLQKFETTFYSLLELHNQSLRELESRISTDKLNVIFAGRPVENLPIQWEVHDSALQHSASEKQVNDIVMYRLKTTQKDILQEVELSQYFRVLYQLLKFVATYNVLNTSHRFDDAYLDSIEKINVEHEKMYTSLIRGFVPVKLLPILAINCIPTGGDDGLHNLDKYQKLLDRYEFLEHIQLKTLPSNTTTFLVLQGYSRALGKNRDVRTKIDTIESKFPYLFAFNSTKKGYVA